MKTIQSSLTAIFVLCAPMVAYAASPTQPSATSHAMTLKPSMGNAAPVAAAKFEPRPTKGPAIAGKPAAAATETPRTPSRPAAAAAGQNNVSVGSGAALAPANNRTVARPAPAQVGQNTSTGYTASVSGGVLTVKYSNGSTLQTQSDGRGNTHQTMLNAQGGVVFSGGVRTQQHFDPRTTTGTTIRTNYDQRGDVSRTTEVVRPGGTGWIASTNTVNYRR